MIRRQRLLASPRVVFIGRRCDLSAIPLQGLLAGDITVAACLIPARRLPGRPVQPVRLLPPTKLRRLPLLAVAPTTSIDQITTERQIPLYEITKGHSGSLIDLLTDIAPDVIVVSCFPWKLSTEALDIPSFGTINVHPSLLPRHRGPDPLFWTFQRGEPETGVSVHLMTDKLDAGPLIEQMTLPLPEPMEGVRVERRLARMAAATLPGIVRRLATGSIELEPQDESRASYEGWPEDEDLLMSTEWPVERVRRFVAGIPSLGYTPAVEIRGERQEIELAVAASEAKEGEAIASLFEVNFADGPAWLQVHEDSEEPPF